MNEYNRPPAPAGAVDASRFAPADRGVTGGDAHDHVDGRGETIAWSALGGRPATFPPSPHGHAVAEITALQAALDDKATAGHGHPVSDVAGLQSALDGKAAASHVHATLDVAGLQAALDAKEPAIGAKGAAFNKSFGTTPGSVCAGDDSRLSDARAPLAHGHSVAEITALQAALDGKAAAGHGHAVADVTGLQSALDGKAAASHSHDSAYAALAHVGAGGAAHSLATASAAGFVPAYEEGSWTPVLAGDGAAGSNAYDAANTGGRYVRIGKLVFIQGRAKVTAVSGMTGNLTIKGLPFALASVGGYGHAMATSGVNGLSGVAAGNAPVALLANGVTSAYLQMQSSAGLSLVAASQCAAGTDVYISGSYIKG